MVGTATLLIWEVQLVGLSEETPGIRQRAEIRGVAENTKEGGAGT